MKKVLIVFIIFFVMTECFSQPHIIFDSVIGSQVTSHWKFHAGDDSRWANKVMDESGWLNIEPGKSLSQMPKEVLSEKGWYRIHFRIDTAARDTKLALLIDQYGSS